MNIFKNIGKAIKNLVNTNADNGGIVIKGNNTGTIMNITQNSSGSNYLNIGGDISGNFNNGDFTKGNGHVIKKQYNEIDNMQDLKSFIYKGSFDIILNIDPDNKNSLTIEGEENILSLIDVKAKNNSIRVVTNGSFSTNKSVTITLSASSLDSLDLGGSFSCKGKYESKKLNVDISGSGSLTLTGNVQELSVNLTGSGDAQLKELMAEEVRAKLTGSGSIKVFAEKIFDGHVTGSGDIKISGQPSMYEAKVTGSGSIEQKGKTFKNKY